MSEKKKTLVVNFCAGPGAGKSILCAATFAALKWRGVSAEMALEYAKDKVWEETETVFKNQLYIFGKQQYRMHRLDGKVDVIVTDGIRYRMYSCERDFEPLAYANLIRLKKSAADLFSRLKRQ